MTNHWSLKFKTQSSKLLIFLQDTNRYLRCSKYTTINIVLNNYGQQKRRVLTRLAIFNSQMEFN
jgi:hypothetical protein